MFDESFIASLPDDPRLAGKVIYDAFQKFFYSDERKTATTGEFAAKYYDEYLKALAVLKAFSEAQGINLEYPSLSDNKQGNTPTWQKKYDDMAAIEKLFGEARVVFDRGFVVGTTETYKTLIEQKFGKGFFYEFSEGDLKRIQVLLNELRDLVRETKELDEDHKSRILQRLEKLQAELHKRVSDLDRFWGLIVDASIVGRKVGENAKLIVDRMHEIVDIVFRVQARVEGLPSNVPFELPTGEKEI